MVTEWDQGIAIPGPHAPQSIYHPLTLFMCYLTNKERVSKVFGPPARTWSPKKPSC